MSLVAGALRILVADDHPIVREGLRAVLAAAPGLTLVGAATTGQEAVDLAAREHPDIVVMDLHMPELDGVEATRRILAAHPATAVLVLTMHEDDDALLAALRAGARGYLLKGATHRDIVHALHAVASGEAVFGSGVADRVLQQLSGRRGGADVPALLTVMFTDIVGSTRTLVERGNRAWRGVLEHHDRLVRDTVAARHGRYVKSTGDGCLATFAAPGEGIACALEIVAAVRGLGLEVRAGLHAGECEVHGGDVAGLAVHVAARVVDCAAASQVLVTQTVAELVAGSGIPLVPHGAHRLEHLAGEWALYAVATSVTDAVVESADEPGAPTGTSPLE